MQEIALVGHDQKKGPFPYLTDQESQQRPNPKRQGRTQTLDAAAPGLLKRGQWALELEHGPKYTSERPSQ
jgi:hypothetical protein